MGRTRRVPATFEAHRPSTSREAVEELDSYGANATLRPNCQAGELTERPQTLSSPPTLLPSLERTIIVSVRGSAFLRERRVGIAAAIGSTAVLVGALAPFQHKVGLLNEGLLFLLLTLLVSSTWGWQV